MTVERSARNLLTSLGIGHFNATMMIQDMFISPMTSDPRSPQIMAMVGALQQNLMAMGYPVSVSKVLDRATADALTDLLGSGWEQYSWSDTITGVLAAKKVGNVYQHPPVEATPPVQNTMAGFGDTMPFGLPDVPGGVLTYVAAAGIGWYLWTKHKKKGRS